MASTFPAEHATCRVDSEGRESRQACLVRKAAGDAGHESDALIAARDENNVLISEAFAVFHHPQWAKVGELVAAGAIGRLRHVQEPIPISMSIRNIAIRRRSVAALRIGVYPVMVTRSVRSGTLRVRATIQRDDAFGTDIDDSIVVISAISNCHLLLDAHGCVKP